MSYYRCLFVILIFLIAPIASLAQNPVGVIEGQVSDGASRAVQTVRVAAKHLDTGFTLESVTGAGGHFRLVALPIGPYQLIVEAPGFARTVQQPIQINASQTVRVDVKLRIAAVSETVTVTADPTVVDNSTNTLGKTVTGREILDLPLNGRNFTQLGLLQTGVAQLTSGVAAAGGSLRQGQAYAVNGMRPETNLFLLDGAQNINRMDGGFALRVPVDAIAEFRILTQTAPAEYGGTAGATTTVVTRGGTNSYHGGLYEFLRNDKVDARNFFSSQVEPLKQNQFGGTAGGPVIRDKLFFFGYYEGFRNRQGFTNSATVPTEKQKQGDYSETGTTLVNLAAGGTPFPNNRIPANIINPVALNVLKLYPAGNVASNIYRATVVAGNTSNQPGGRLDFNASENDRFFARYSFSGGTDDNPISVRGSEVPGFPTRNNITAHSAVLSNDRILSPRMSNSLRATFFRYIFEFDRRLNRTPPREFGFNYDSASSLGQGPPFFNVSGYSPIGGAITGPRDSVQNSYELQDGLAWSRGAHSVKVGVDFLRTQINMFQSIAPNAFFVFASTFPTNDAIANLLLGSPVTFYQGLGDFRRGLRIWHLGTFLQDEWRISRTFTLNLGVRYERINPIAEIRDRLNAFVPGVQSTVRPDAPKGLLFPGDSGIGKGIAQSNNAFMPRVGFVWDPFGRGALVLRASYGVFFDGFQNGAGTASQGPVSSLPWTQFNQYSGAGLNFADPYRGQIYPAPGTFARPSTVFALNPSSRPPYAQNWNFGIQRSLWKQHLLEVRYVGTKGTRLPRNVEANPAVFGPGATAQNADRRRIYANCPPTGATCDFSTIAVLSNITNSTYHAGQLSLSRRYSAGFAFNVSYWFSKTLDYLSAMNLSGSAAKPLSGENDLAQNPFNLAAEHGPSLFDARHRFVASGSYELRLKNGPRPVRALLSGWQFNVIATHNSPTPFTVSDSTNVSLQANSPPISGFAASRPNVIRDPNQGPHTVDAWLSRTAFQRLNPQTQAGQFGNAGRNIARGPSLTNFDISLARTFRIAEATGLQFRFESFNVANHANFGLPVSDLNAATFGRIFTAGPPRLLQIGCKLIF
ncbi:MAG: TonB-dependent receptor [Bryobacteraceae bacterium]|nr:TonB-dependent receptor [Bryobacteraceae bacterium]